MPNWKNERPTATPEGLRNPLVIPRTNVPGKGKFVDARINKGMVTSIDPSDIEPGALQVAKNARVRYDKTQRRSGSVVFSPAAPNTNPVLTLGYHKKNNNTKYVTRFTASSIHYLSGGSWATVSAGAGGSLTGAVTDRFRAITVFDRYVFTNNGVDVLQEIDFSLNQYKALGNDSPKYKYITGFANRIIGAYYTGTPGADPTAIGWSADGNIDEWNPLTDESAGTTPLIDSPSDRADFITGVFGLTNSLLVMREESIWLGTKQPIPQFPIYFYNAFPGLGSDCPDSIQVAMSGTAWLDTRTSSVWHYQPGGQPARIGLNVEQNILSGVTDASSVYASFDPIEQEYTIVVPQNNSWNKLWTFNFKMGSWVYDERAGLSCLNDIDYAIPTTTIDDLGDIPIDQLEGTIDGLSPDRQNVPTRFFGIQNGNLLKEDDNTFVDPIYIAPGGPIIGPPIPGYETYPVARYSTELLSKTFEIPSDDIYICEIDLEFIPKAEGDIEIQYSKDGGYTFSTGKVISTDPARLNIPTQYRWVKQIRCRKFAFKVIGLDGQWELVHYTIYVYKGAESADD